MSSPTQHGFITLCVEADTDVHLITSGKDQRSWLLHVSWVRVLLIIYMEGGYYFCLFLQCLGSMAPTQGRQGWQGETAGGAVAKDPPNHLLPKTVPATRTAFLPVPLPEAWEQ